MNVFQCYFCIIIVALFYLNANGYQVKDAPLLTKRPPWLLACRRNDPQLNKCLNDLFDKMFPELAKGIPIMNVDPFEPLYLDRVSVSKGSGPIILTGSLYNLTVIGPSNSTPTYTEFDPIKKKWNFGLDLPLLVIKSQYNLKGKILVLPLVGHGGCDLRLGKVQTKVKTDFSFLVKEGKEVMHIDKMHVGFTVGSMRVKLYNLFNGNKVLGQTVNTFMNQNAIEIVNELSDSIGESLAKIFTEIINNIYTKIPVELFLLTDEQYEEYLKEKQ